MTAPSALVFAAKANSWLARTNLAVRSSTTIALRHLYSLAEITNLRGDGEVEVRWAAIPNSWKQPVEGIFKEETMRSLSDLGHQLGATPEAWHTEAP